MRRGPVFAAESGDGAVSRLLPVCKRSVKSSGRLARRPGPTDASAIPGAHDGLEEWGVRDRRDYVLRTVEERGIRFVQLWFTDVLGTPKTFNITPAELENALDEGMTFDGSRHRRVQPGPGVRCARPAGRQHVPAHPVARTRRAGRPGVLRHLQPRPDALRGLPAPRRCGARSSGPSAAGYTFFASPEVEYFYFADTEVDPTRPPRPIDSGSYFDLTGADASSDLRRRTVLTLEEMGIPVEHAQHEDAPGPARDRPALHRRADHGRHGDDRAPRREGDGPHRSGIHASFMPKPLAGRAGLGDAHPPVAVARGAQRLQRPDGRLRALAGGQALHRRPAPPRPRDHRHHQPVGQLLQAARPRLRGAGPRELGPQQPQRPRPGPGGEGGQAGVDPRRVPRAGLGVQPLPRLRGDARRRPAAGSRSATSCRRRPTPTSSTSPPASWPPRASARSRSA